MKKKNNKKQQLKILIVDDNEFIRNALQHLLQNFKEFISVIEQADSGETAIEMTTAKDFDLILMDYSMGGISGARAIKEIRKIKPAVRIMGVSSYTTLSIAEDMINAGANGYLIKNLQGAELLAAIKTILQGKTYYDPEIMEKMH